MYDLYELIKSECEKNGITVSAMCLELGMSKSMMSDLHSGKKKSLSTDKLSKIANYFNVSVDYLLTGEQKEKPSVNDDEELEKLLEMYRTRPECRMLFSLANGATVEDVKKAAAIIEALRKVDGR